MALLNTLLTPAFTTAWNGSSFSSTHSITVSAGQDYLIVRLGAATPPAMTITYGGSALAALSWVSDTNSRTAGIYVLATPPAGTADLIIDTGGGSRSGQACVDEASGISAIGTPDAFGGFRVNSSATLATAAGDIVIDLLSADQIATAGAGQITQVINTNNFSASSKTATATSTTLSWTHAGDHVVHSAVVLTAGAAGPTINTIDAQARTGGSVSFTVSNFTGAITGANINDGTLSLNASSVIDNGGGSYTANFPSLSTLPVMPRPSTGLTFEATNATESATAAIELLPDSGFDSENTITPALGLLPKDWGFNQSNLDATDHYIWRLSDVQPVETRIVEHFPNGQSVGYRAGTYLVYGWDSTDGQISKIEITLLPEGGGGIGSDPIISVVIESSQITSNPI